MAKDKQSKVKVLHTKRWEVELPGLMRLVSVDDVPHSTKVIISRNNTVQGETLLNIDDFLELAEEVKKVSRGP